MVALYKLESAYLTILSEVPDQAPYRLGKSVLHVPESEDRQRIPT